MSKIFLVQGCPGGGKTTYLTRQARSATEKHGGEHVVAISLTKTAAAEIGRRDTSIPDENCSTMHAACYHALDRPKLAETPEGLRAWNDQHPNLALSGGQDRLEDTPVDADTGRTRGDELHTTVMNHRARMTDPYLWTDQQRDYLTLWEDFKRQTEREDFTDLIERALRETTTHPAAPRVLLLDEAQDFSRLELALAAHWSASTETTVIVGDPHQALYAWRGSDPDALERLHVAGRRTLEHSYRVPVAVHALAGRWLHSITGARLRYHPTEHPGDVSSHTATLRHPEQILGRIDEDLERGESIMILTTCGYMLAPVLAVLRDRGLPFHNPYRVKAGAWNPMRGAGRLLAYLRPSTDAWGEQARFWTWDDLRRWSEPLRARTALARGAKTLIEAKCTPDQFGESQADETVSLDTLADLLGTTDPDHPALRGDLDWWAGQLRANQAKRFEYPLTVLRHGGPRKLRDTPKITIGTVHSVKGGEADSVYIFPDLSRTGMQAGWHRAGETRAQIARMFYVAITRARARVTLLDPAGPDHAPLAAITGGGEPIAAHGAGVEHGY